MVKGKGEGDLAAAVEWMMGEIYTDEDGGGGRVLSAVFSVEIRRGNRTSPCF